MTYRPEDVLELALAGSRRVPAPEPLPGGEGLDVVGLLAAARTLDRAGHVFERPTPHVTSPAPADTWATAPVESVALLDTLLGSSERAALDVAAEWLHLAARRHLLPPTRLWPRILKGAESHPHLARVLSEVESPTLAWVASQNPQWRRFPRIDVTGWAEASDGQRTRLVSRLLAEDPAALVTLLSEGLAGLPAKSRAAALSGIIHPLPGLVPVLESLLDDRSDVVRVEVVRILSQDRASALSSRLAALVPSWVERSGMLRATVTFTPPEVLDDDAKRDGLTLPTSDRPESAGWVHRLAASAPLPAWEEATRLSPEALFAATIRAAKDGSPFARAATWGWREAAVIQRDVRWAAALAPGTGTGVPPIELVRLLPDAEQADLLYPRRSDRDATWHVLTELRGEVPGESALGPLLERRLVERLLSAGDAATHHPELVTMLRPDRHDPGTLERLLGPLHHLWQLRQSVHQQLGDVR